MALPEPLRGCLDTLTSHCRALQAEKDALFQETQKLKQQLAAIAEQSKSPDMPSESAAEKVLFTLHQQIPGSLQDPEHAGVGRDAWISPVGAYEEKLDNSLLATQDTEPKADLKNHDSQEGQPGMEVLHVRTMGAARLGINDTQDLSSHFDAKVEPTRLCGHVLHALFNDKDNHDDAVETARVCSLERLVQSLTFRLACLFLIMVNSIFTGVRMDTEMRRGLKRLEGGPVHSDNIFFYTEIVFASWFSLELLLRVIAERWNFVYGDNKSYNLMDTVLILLSIADIFLPRLPAASFLRLFRAFRIIRIARLVQSIPTLKPLRTMLFAIMNSFTALLWALFMIVLTMFIFSVLVGSAVLDLFQTCDIHSATDIQRAEQLAPYFGNLYRTMVTLFASITGGDDWMAAARHLRALDAGEFYFVVYCLFIFFCLVGLFNVVNGIFVDSAVCTRTEDEVVQHFRDDEQRTSEEIRRIFQQSDKDGNGRITLHELQTQIQNPWVKAYFAGLDIDPREAGIIFTLVDTDNSGELTLDEFIGGILKMKGGAKGVDVLAIMFDHQRLALSFNALCSYIEQELGEIKEAVKPSLGKKQAKSLAQTLAALDRGGGKFIDAYDVKDVVKSTTIGAIVHD